MSTKTLRKRIALVAVSALGFGLVSSVPAFAGEADANETTAIAIAAVAGNSNAINLANSFTISLDPVNTDNDDAYTIKTRISSMPVGVDSVSLTAAAGGADIGGADGSTTYASGTTATMVATAAVGATLAALASTAVGRVTFTPTVAGSYTITSWHDVDGDGTINGSEVSASAVANFQAGGSATEASIKGTATSVNVSAVSLTTVEPSNRVGVPVIATPAASFLNTSANDTTTDSHKASLIYVLTKPVGSASTLNATSATILSGAAIDGTDADGAGTTVGETASRSGSNLTFTPDVAGTYTITAWHESVVDGALSTSEATASRSFVVGANELKMTISTFGSLVKGADDAGSLLVKIALTGADGKAASLNTNESIVVTRTAGTAAIDFVTNDGTFAAGFGNGSAADTAASTYTFNAAQFSSAGVAAFLVNDDTAAGLSTWTINGAGGSAAALSYSMTTTASAATTAAATNGAGTISNATGVAGTVTNGGNATTAATIAYGKATTVAFTYTRQLQLISHVTMLLIQAVTSQVLQVLSTLRLQVQLQAQ